MASTPLYRSLKSKGTSFYAFPGAADDISAAYQNSNRKMYFTKFALLNFPKQNTNPGTQSNPIVFDFDSAFSRSANATSTVKYGDALVESLRNYVANHEIVMRESKLNSTKYYYDNTSLSTPTEHIFWKWCRKLNVIDFEPAIPEDEYFSNLNEFKPNKTNDDSYFPEYLWKEREIIPWDTLSFGTSIEVGYTDNLEIEFSGETNIRVGDTVAIYAVTNSLIAIGTLAGVETDTGLQFGVLKVIPSTATTGQRIIFDVNVSGHLGQTPLLETTGQAEIVYHRLVQYIGEVSGVSNVNSANRSYTEVYAQIPDQNGMTPDILFRTGYDVNYRPNLSFPIIPGQVQPEIMGAENFSSPIVSSPQNYPGSYFGQFDTMDFKYETSPGDVLRRSGNYFGVTGDVNSTTIDTSKMDGLGIDFNTSHYVKMNIVNRQVTNFDQFNALMVNNIPPDDFEFNAILWFYAAEDQNGNVSNNVYGISFLDNPDNNKMSDETGLRFPTYPKLVANGNQDGTSYAFGLNLNFNVINDNPQDAYNPDAINSLFSMNLFNDAMTKLSSTNDSFLGLIASQNAIATDLLDLKGLIYSQTDINTINSKITNLENLLRLYSTMQMASSDTIKAVNIPGNPPVVQLNNVSTGYIKVDNVNVTDLYNTQGIIPLSISVPDYQDWLVDIVNNDETPLVMPNGDRLAIVISKDLYYKQSVEFTLRANTTATQNKKLDIYIQADIESSVQNISTTNKLLLVGNIDLPIMYNPSTSAPNSASRLGKFNYNIDMNSDIQIGSGSLLTLPLDANQYVLSNSVKVGDTLVLNDFLVGTASVYDFSGQYSVVAVGAKSITMNLSSNATVSGYVSSNSSALPLTVHSSTFSTLSAMPYLSLNRGKRIVITRRGFTTPSLVDRYKIDIKEI